MSPMTSVTVAPTAAASSIVGRSDAIERLRSAWQLARAGKRQIVWIVGDPGVGKTTLIEYLMAEVGEGYCAHGQCVDQSGAGEPYLPILDALGALCRNDPSVAALIRAIAPMWLVQLPWLSSAEEREALRRELSGSGQPRMLREFVELLERGTENRPIVLVTEDLHWSDPATVQLMDHVARRRGTARLLWIASFRLTEVIGTDHPLASLRHELRLHGLAEEIILDAFSEQEVADYVGARMPGLAGDETFVRALHARTEGLPLFVADVVEDLIADAKAGVEGESAARLRLASMGLPENLAGIVEQYMQGLTPQERTLLEAASVCGAEFRVATIAAVLETDIASIGASCVELSRGQRWLTDVPPGRPSAAREPRYAFRHALYREVLYNGIGPVARRDFHRKAATVLERERTAGGEVTAAELAFHFEQAQEWVPAVRYYAEAAEWALLHASAALTMDLTERALALLPLTAERSERAALELTLTTLRGAAAIQAHGISAPDVKEAFVRAQALLEDAPQHPLRGLFLHPLGLALCMRGELDEAEALARRSEAFAASTGDPTALLCAEMTHGLVHHLRGRPRMALQWLEKAFEICVELDRSTSRAVFIADPGVIALGLLAIDSLHVGRIEEGHERIAAMHARARDLRAAPPRMAALWLEGFFQVRLRNAVRVLEISEQLRSLADEYRAATWPRASSVVPRMGASANGASAGRVQPHPGGVRIERAVRHACMGKRSARLRRGGARYCGGLACVQTRARGSNAMRRGDRRTAVLARATSARCAHRGCARRTQARGRIDPAGRRRSARAGSAVARDDRADSALRAQRRHHARPRGASPPA